MQWPKLYTLAVFGKFVFIFISGTETPAKHQMFYLATLDLETLAGFRKFDALTLPTIRGCSDEKGGAPHKHQLEEKAADDADLIAISPQCRHDNAMTLIRDISALIKKNCSYRKLNSVVNFCGGGGG